jgi:hypothetical protein
MHNANMNRRLLCVHGLRPGVVPDPVTSPPANVVLEKSQSLLPAGLGRLVGFQTMLRRAQKG